MNSMLHGPILIESLHFRHTLRTFTGCDSQRWENNSIAKTGNDSASYTLRWERQCQMIER